MGVLHTNYRELTKRNAGYAGLPLCGLSHLLNFLACSIHCHKASHWPCFRRHSNCVHPPSSMLGHACSDVSFHELHALIQASSA